MYLAYSISSSPTFGAPKVMHCSCFLALKFFGKPKSLGYISICRAHRIAKAPPNEWPVVTISKSS